MNIEDQTAIHSCTSCQMCAAVCPVSAITIKLDSFGFYRPVLNTTLCIDCELCVKVCYKYHVVAEQNLVSLNKIEMWAASACDNKILQHTTSGGIAYLLAQDLVKRGVKCVGVEYDLEQNRAKHIIASDLDEIIKFRGSKYIQS